MEREAQRLQLSYYDFTIIHFIILLIARPSIPRCRENFSLYAFLSLIFHAIEIVIKILKEELLGHIGGKIRCAVYREGAQPCCTKYAQRCSSKASFYHTRYLRTIAAKTLTLLLYIASGLRSARIFNDRSIILPCASVIESPGTVYSYLPHSQNAPRFFAGR